MNAVKITYWLTTGLVAAGMLVSFFNYMFNPAMITGYAHIGFPDWFRVELGIAKLLGAIALIVPKISGRIKEWAYFGFFVNFISAILAHYAVNDPVINMIAPLVMLILLIISYISYHKHLLKF
ncbi:DoxX family protein [Mucilaginibacter lacusdianchii]|uniref:DoxX family protein n=1 Tax=Mucilaginibacter lacusdianchii TaxID=2684211 RepID=UPI00131E25C6|nr:DoxX family protein [Mucilaginibacter sp. JXJ CY 39]